MMEIINWIAGHYLELVEAYLALIGFASIVIKMTPTLKDDAVLKNVIRFVGKFIALNRK